MEEEKLSAEVLKVHNANLNHREMTSGSHIGGGSMSSGVSKMNHRDRMFGGEKHDKGDKHSESSSKVSSTIHTKDRFHRLRSKLRMHTLFGSSLTRSRCGSEKGGIIRHLENTYKVGPDDGTQFVVSKAERIMKTILVTYLKDKKYDAKKFPQLCRSLSDLVKERIKMSGVKRYKVMAYVVIVEEKKQSVNIASRCLWDSSLDNFATVTYQGIDFTAIASVFVTYYE